MFLAGRVVYYYQEVPGYVSSLVRTLYQEQDLGQIFFFLALPVQLILSCVLSLIQRVDCDLDTSKRSRTLSSISKPRQNQYRKAFSPA